MPSSGACNKCDDVLYTINQSTQFNFFFKFYFQYEFVNIDGTKYLVNINSYKLCAVLANSQNTALAVKLYERTCFIIQQRG